MVLLHFIGLPKIRANCWQRSTKTAAGKQNQLISHSSLSAKRFLQSQKHVLCVAKHPARQSPPLSLCVHVLGFYFTFHLLLSSGIAAACNQFNCDSLFYHCTMYFDMHMMSSSSNAI